MFALVGGIAGLVALCHQGVISEGSMLCYRRYKGRPNGSRKGIPRGTGLKRRSRKGNKSRITRKRKFFIAILQNNNGVLFTSTLKNLKPGLKTYTFVYRLFLYLYRKPFILK